MLKPELARQQLQQWQAKAHLEARFARARKLPKPERETALGILGETPDGKRDGDWRLREKWKAAAVGLIVDEPELRPKVLKALFPTLAADLEAAWAHLAKQPYTVGHARRSFRAAERPELHKAALQSLLECLIDSAGELPDDMLTAPWLAQWAVHLGYRTAALGGLFAAAIDRGGEQAAEVLEILKDSAANRHAVGGPGSHAMRGLLGCGRPEAWAFMEGLLLAAQRQEGLRQVILEAVDESHPQAFRRMVGVVLDHNLARFASVARAVGVWLGEAHFVEDPKVLKASLQTVAALLDDGAARSDAIATGDAATAYRGLWAVAFLDAPAAVKAAQPLLAGADAGRRFAAAKLCIETALPEAAKPLLALLADPDPAVLSLAVGYAAGLAGGDDEAAVVPPKNLFEQLEKAVGRLPERPKEAKAPVEGWFVPALHRQRAADALPECLGDRPAERLLPYLGMMGEYTRVRALAKLCAPRTLSTKVRKTLLAIAGEPNRYVREAAMKYLAACTLAEDEVRTLEGYLTRKTPDFRRSVFDLLLNRDDRRVCGTIDRLLDAGDLNSRAAGIEVSRRMVDGERSAEVVREKLREYRERKGKRLPGSEAQAIEIVLNPAARPPTLDDGLGLFDPADRSGIVPPKKRKVKFATPASRAFLKHLDDFLHEHRSKTYVDGRYGGRVEEKVLGSVTRSWMFPGPDARKTAADDREFLPLADFWAEWWATRPAATRDADGFELIRAMMTPTAEVREGEEDKANDDGKEDAKFAAAIKTLRPHGTVGLRYEPLIQALLPWLRKLFPAPGTDDFLLDAAETALALFPREYLVILPTTAGDEAGEEVDEDNDDAPVEWRENTAFVAWLDAVEKSPAWTAEHSARRFRLHRWLDEPTPGARRKRPDLGIVLDACAAGAATLADVLDHLIGPRPKQRWGRESFDALRRLTQANEKEHPAAAKPELREAVDRVVARIVEIELARGETPTAATTPAGSVSRVAGLGTLIDLMAALGKAGYGRQASYGQSENKPAVLTRLIQVCEPQPADTPEAFAAAAMAAVAAGRFEVERVVQLGLVNPKWAAHVAAAVRWPGYLEAVYWFIAHTGSAWGNAFGPDAWQAILKARTNLSAEQRADGLIDVAWFHQAYAAVGSAKRWDAIEAAAKFLGYGQQHKKAARLADVLLGRTKKKELVHEIRAKTLKESVRLLGLLPLPADPAKKDAELADRYKVLKGYERYARTLSSLSKEPAMQAVRLGLENLAVTAGFPDPIRLEWAVTAREVADLAAGPVAVAAKGVEVSLALAGMAEPEVAQARGGKPLKAIPPDVRKHPKVAALLDRKKDLARTAANTKRSLERAMCAGDRFRGAELKGLMGHAIVRPLLERLLLKTPAGVGYPAAGGVALRGWDGRKVAVKANDEWTIAHPLDLAAGGDWHEWQAECFRAERLQPFKQVFREVYAVTVAEKEDGDRSRRYSGQQVNETQAKALLAGRGWSTRDDLSRIYHDCNLVVLLALDHGYATPADAAAPAVGEVVFHRRGDWKRVPLADVPAAVFSEVMRDLDLVVSVAHVGGVDPEASQSTVEMRAALLTETCRLLKVDNVAFEGRHAQVRGGYGRYSVHLGSGVVHKQPGGSLCVVPVNAQHRGRLFLPFADDDPRTAEVVSKVLLFARDTEIQDPGILQQIVTR